MTAPARPATRLQDDRVTRRVVTGLVLAAVGAVVLSVAVGSVTIPPDRVVGVIADRTLPWVGPGGASDVEARIVWEFRLPRALLGLVVGAALAVAGTVLQAVTRNPLADPYVFGVSSGASVGAVAVLTLGAGALGGVLGGVSVPVAAFVGALVTAVVVHLLAQEAGRATPARLVLAGVAVSYVLTAVTSVLVLRASEPGAGVASVLTWLAGSLGSASWADLALPTVVVVTGTVVLAASARVLNAFLTGDETATSLGVDVGRVRLLLFAGTALLVGTVVAVSGAIGFVGLVVPHAVRALVGADHRHVLPVAALAGGVLVVFVDVVARTVLAPTELPVGLLTAAVGGPFFLWILRRSRAWS